MYRVTDEEYDVLWKWTHSFIDQNCIVRNTRMPAKKPGEYYTWIFYLRRGLYNHQFLSAISQMFVYHMERLDPTLNFQLSGLETAAAPMLAGIPLIARVYGDDINSFIVRKERKTYGLLNIIEGVPNDKNVIMLDDLCNSSSSLALCFKELNKLQIPVANKAFVIVNKYNVDRHTTKRGNSDMYLPSDIQVLSLFTMDDFNLTDASH